MGDFAIQTLGLSKQYRIGAAPAELMLRDTLAAAAKRLLGRGPGRAVPESVWALKDLDLEVGRDEVVGVIGRNGSGKTTLLKLLSRITHPTSGTLDVRGRVASLVEVGTGFHNELTGRDNVYLNGAILGLSRREIAERFDEIVEYSGVGPFLDTPIKRYSTGMRLRLGFAVAAHLYPDVLLVDEVLAVGDAEFQSKCLATLGEVGRRGHAVLFVSHNLEAVESLCPRTIWIDRGVLRMDGPSRDVIESYLGDAQTERADVIDLSAAPHRSGSGEARFSGLELLRPDGEPATAVRTGEDLVLRIRYDVRANLRSPYVGVMIQTEFGAVVAHPSTWSQGPELGDLEKGEGSLELRLPRLPLMPGSYPLTLWMNRHSDSVSVDYLEQCATLVVAAPDPAVTGRLLKRRNGAVLLDATWHVAD